MGMARRKDFAKEMKEVIIRPIIIIIFLKPTSTKPQAEKLG